ncbi:MAG: CaiB/BaiF CoA-transferase family protein [Chloroflexi bacterium]|nr:CaiB/BaiF CoA-transferase family protein [Chloroflexota bacterium]
MKPLHATRILDLTRLLPGAVCTMLLRDLGAEIIKIEDPNGGDYARSMPPLIDGLGAFFRASNLGKKSVVIDLKAEAGQAVLHRLVETADVLMEGFRPGVTARLGADFETLSAVNPRLVYCSLSGWGQSGPYAQVSGHDLNYIARNGVLGAEQSPRTPGAQAADVGGSYVAATGILAALLQRLQTGVGAYNDVALSEAAMPMALAAWVEAMTPAADESFISLRGESACYNVYQSADGQPLALGAIEPKFWANFCRAVEMPEWIAQHTSRHHQPDLIAAVAARFKTKPAAEWAALLDDADCCFSRVISPAQLLNDRQMQARGLVGITEDGLPWMRSPIRLSGDAFNLEAAPAYGEHTRETLGEIGYAADEIDGLIDAGVIRQAP